MSLSPSLAYFVPASSGINSQGMTSARGSDRTAEIRGLGGEAGDGGGGGFDEKLREGGEEKRGMVMDEGVKGEPRE